MEECKNCQRSSEDLCNELGDYYVLESDIEALLTGKYNHFSRTDRELLQEFYDTLQQAKLEGKELDG